MKKNILISGSSKKLLLSVLLLFTIALPVQVSAQVVALDRGKKIDEKRTGWLPYIFATESLGWAIGAGAFSASGKKQPQSSLFGTGFVTSNGSALVSGAWNNHRLGKSRFFFDGFVLADHFTDQRFYAGPDIDPNKPRAGTNDSDPEAYVTGVSNEVTFTASLKYRLPIGNLKDDPVAVYHLYQGLLESGPQGGETWNPLTNGQTTVAGKFFYTYRDLNDFVFNEFQTDPIDEHLSAKSNGLEFWLEYDNTDFPRNPTRGSRQLLKATSDFGWAGSDESWTNLEADFSKYFNLGDSDWFRQKAVALNFWTSNSPSWEESANGDLTHTPPPMYGSSLGGYDRMRGYPSRRFHDKSAVYYSAELRLIPQTQPLRDLPLLNYFEIDWWQVVPFVEAGRVSDKYDTDLFIKDLKVDAGIGLRFMAFRAVVRLDWAVSDEGSSVWAMISQPFSRQGN
ncbi:MAG: BamA/TamA family outer membrane protein [Pseudomonadota bacterium]|nr:BamA/TamA family outer membrane protein [Pseudomonadota bacterium]